MSASTTDIGRRSIGGGVASLAGQGVRLGLRATTLVALARLLDPTDFGLVAMTWIVTQLGVTLWDLGLGMATVQREDIRDEQISTLFWINLGLGAVVTLISALSAPALAWYYSEPRLLVVTLALAPVAVIASAGLQHQALLSRLLRHGANAATALVAAVVASVAAVVAALAGAGLWSLVAMRLVEQAVATAGLWWTCAWRPARPRWSDGMGPLLTFGGNLAGVRAVDYLLANADKLLIGRYLGAPALGLYVQAQQFVHLPLRQFHLPTQRVAIAGLSRLLDDPERFRRYYRNGLLLVATATVPTVAFLALEAPLLIAVVLGPKWSGMVPLLRILAPAALVAGLNPMLQWLWVATGRSGAQLRWMLVRTPLTIAALAIGLRWGSVGVAAALSAAALILRPLEIPLCLRGTPIGASDLVWAAGRPMLAAAVACWVTWQVQNLASFAPAVELVAAAVVYAISFAASWASLPGRRQALDLLWSLAQTLRQRGR